MNKTKIKKILNISSLVVSIGLLVGAISGAAMGCIHALYLLIPAFGISLYFIYNILQIMKTKFNKKSRI